MIIYVSEIIARLISQWLERLVVSDGLIKAPEKTGKHSESWHSTRPEVTSACFTGSNLMFPHANFAL